MRAFFLSSLLAIQAFATPNSVLAEMGNLGVLDDLMKTRREIALADSAISFSKSTLKTNQALHEQALILKGTNVTSGAIAELEVLKTELDVDLAAVDIKFWTVTKQTAEVQERVDMKVLEEGAKSTEGFKDLFRKLWQSREQMARVQREKADIRHRYNTKIRHAVHLMYGTHAVSKQQVIQTEDAFVRSIIDQSAAEAQIKIAEEAIKKFD